MLEEKTVIDEVTVLRSGHVQVKYAILILKDGAEKHRDIHRVVVDPGEDVDAKLASIDGNLQLRGIEKLSDVDGVSLLKNMARLAHTPEKVAAHRARLEEADAALRDRKK